jgi:hypothetical protein
MLISMGVLAFMLSKLHKQVGHQYCSALCKELQPSSWFGTISLYFSALWSSFNHFVIWLDPEVVAHDKLIATKSGYLNFPFWLQESDILNWMEFIDIILLKLFGTDESNDDSFYKRRTLIFCWIS